MYAERKSEAGRERERGRKITCLRQQRVKDEALCPGKLESVCMHLDILEENSTRLVSLDENRGGRSEVCSRLQDSL